MRNKEYSWFMLSNAPGFGVKSIHYINNNLKLKGKSINDLFDLNYNELISYFPEIGRGKFSRANLSALQELDHNEKIYNYFEKIRSTGVTIIGLDDDRYPKSVLQSMGDNAPAILYCKGHLPLLNQKSISIVGARDVGEFEVSITKSIASKLAESGFNVTSGYAKGVDTSAHLGALEAQGTTTMILSFGTNHITIKRELKEVIREKSILFVSQFAPHEKFSGQNAMARNKLVCAMSEAIVVIKSGPERDGSGKMSGTFDAGKSALNMGVPVFILSPQLLRPAAQGNIDLIKLGGIEFSNPMDIVEFFERSSDQSHSSANGNNNTIQNEKSDLSNNTTKPYQTRLFE